MKIRMRKSVTRLLALAATTAVVGLGATGAGATLLGDTVYACGNANLATSANALQLGQAACGTGNVFSPSSATVSSNVEFTQLLGKLGWTAQVDVGGTTGGSDSFTLTFTSAAGSVPKALPTTAGNVAAFFLAGLNFADGSHITGISFIGNANGLVDTAGAQSGYYDGSGAAAFQPLAGDYILLGMNSAAFGTVGPGTYSLTGTITTGVPEPGSLALLGVVLIALALVYVGRVRLFGFRSMGQKLAS